MLLKANPECLYPRIQYTVPGCSTPLIFNGKDGASRRLADWNEQCIMGQNAQGSDSLSDSVHIAFCIGLYRFETRYIL